MIRSVFACVCVHGCIQDSGVGVPSQQSLTPWFDAVNRSTFDNSRNMWKRFGLENFFSQKFLYLVYPTEKTALFYTIFIYSTSHCATAKDIWSFSYNIVRRLCSSKSQYFYRLMTFTLDLQQMRSTIIAIWIPAMGTDTQKMYTES